MTAAANGVPATIRIEVAVILKLSNPRISDRYIRLLDQPNGNI
jgi:hypothetical protein